MKPSCLFQAVLQDGAKKQNGATAGDFQLANGADFACPLTGLPMNGRYRFSVLRKTGHVLSEKALKEVFSFITHSFCWSKHHALQYMPVRLGRASASDSLLPSSVCAARWQSGTLGMAERRLGIGCPLSFPLGYYVESFLLLHRFQLLWRRWWETRGLQRMFCL